MYKTSNYLLHDLLKLFKTNYIAMAVWFCLIGRNSNELGEATNCIINKHTGLSHKTILKSLEYLESINCLYIQVIGKKRYAKVMVPCQLVGYTNILFSTYRYNLLSGMVVKCCLNTNSLVLESDDQKTYHILVPKELSLVLFIPENTHVSLSVNSISVDGTNDVYLLNNEVLQSNTHEIIQP